MVRDCMPYALTVHVPASRVHSQSGNHMHSNEDEKADEFSATALVHHDPIADITVASSSPPDAWRRPGREMARKKVSTTIYIEPEQLERLKLLNERTKVPMAEYIREGINLVLAKHHDKLPGQLPLEANARKQSDNG